MQQTFMSDFKFHSLHYIGPVGGIILDMTGFEIFTIIEKYAFHLIKTKLEHFETFQYLMFGFWIYFFNVIAVLKRRKD